jgi:hypothetical protein
MTKVNNIVLAYFLLYFYILKLFAHDIVVHENITVNAVASATESSFAYNSFLSVVSSDYCPEAAERVLRIGSALEDIKDVPGDTGKHVP